ncbi:MAG TPA: site-specific DNA-methyltransferase [Candidatus Aquilonibacter sp.]|nr:site-specific DNA-methyltransferase [Candidatus Aquilonibacter sp.]
MSAAPASPARPGNGTRNTRLELTWIGKENRPRLEPRILLEDADKSYHAAQRVSDKDIFDNRLIFGDNLLALTALEQEFAGRVKCIYIDPPFNTGEAFEHYDDGIEHSIWLSLMRDRLSILHRLLAKDGSLFIHIDDNELGYLIALVDEIFDRSNRIAVISFKQSAASGPKSINPGLVSTSNFILYYAKQKASWKPNRVYVPIARDVRYNNFILNRQDPHNLWKLGTLREAFAKTKNVSVRELDKTFGAKLEKMLTEFVIANRFSVVQPALVRPEDINDNSKKALQESIELPNRVTKSATDERYFLNGKQLLFYSSKVQLIDGNLTTAGLASTIWDDLLSNNVHKEGGVSFPDGKKPEALIKRVLELSTKPGELVLDSFAGSGTTSAVAHKMGRQWITIELRNHVDSHVAERLKRVINAEEPSGISTAVGWNGGGGFRYFRLAPSMLELDRFGNHVISSKYNAAMLAEAMCKLMGFRYEPGELYWQQGRSTETDFLYTTTQTLSRQQLESLSEEVGPNRSLLICCSAFRGKAADYPNLTIRKIPIAVLARCEWGKDDYSLNVANLPKAPEPNEEDMPEPLAESAHADRPPRNPTEAKKRRAKAAKQDAPSLFEEVAK